MMIRFLDPTQPVEILPVTLAPRRLIERPVTIGLLANGKSNAAALLRLVVNELKEQLPIAGVVEFAKQSASTNAPDEMLDQLAEDCDLAIVAIGD
jgi:hypothetical protein